jgi:hypothetical protein
MTRIVAGCASIVECAPSIAMFSRPGAGSSIQLVQAMMPSRGA